MYPKNVNYPPYINHAGSSCTPCHTKDITPCGKVCGIFEFKGPAKVYSFNATEPYHTFMLIEDNRNFVCMFGGENSDSCNPKISSVDYDICGKYEIEWCVCEGDPIPEFHTAPINPSTTNIGCDGCGSTDLKPVCIKRAGDGDAVVINGWIDISCKESDVVTDDGNKTQLLFKMWGSSGEPLDSALYHVVSCC